MDAPYYNGEPGDTDVCTEEPLTCQCPECRTWRDNYEPPDHDYDGAAELHARRTDPTHPANVEIARLRR